jgi:hypothetical protein
LWRADIPALVASKDIQYIPHYEFLKNLSEIDAEFDRFENTTKVQFKRVIPRKSVAMHRFFAAVID